MLLDAEDRIDLQQYERVQQFILSAEHLPYTDLIQHDFLKGAKAARTLMPLALVAEASVYSVNYFIESRLHDLRETSK